MVDDMKKILILDDEIVIRVSLSDYFEDCGWTVYPAVSGTEALQMVGETDARIALVDVRLGDMLGVEFIRKASVVNSKIVFCVFTGSPEYELPDDIKTNQQVNNEIILKPIIDLSAFEKRMRELLNSYGDKKV